MNKGYKSIFFCPIWQQDQMSYYLPPHSKSPTTFSKAKTLKESKPSSAIVAYKGLNSKEE